MKYMLLIYAAEDTNGASGAPEGASYEDWQVYDKALVSRFGDLDLAEEVTSEAIEAALTHWPVDGVPKRPGAWPLTELHQR